MNSRILCHLRGNLFSVPATMSSRWKHFITITLHRPPPLIPADMTKYLYIQYSGYVYCLLAPRPPLKPNEMNPFRSYYYTFIFHFVSSASASFLLLVLLLVYCQVSHPHPHPPTYRESQLYLPASSLSSGERQTHHREEWIQGTSQDGRHIAECMYEMFITFVIQTCAMFMFSVGHCNEISVDVLRRRLGMWGTRDEE